jgi:hypothetical protein
MATLRSWSDPPCCEELIPARSRAIAPREAVETHHISNSVCLSNERPKAGGSHGQTCKCRRDPALSAPAAPTEALSLRLTGQASGLSADVEEERRAGRATSATDARPNTKVGSWPGRPGPFLQAAETARNCHTRRLSRTTRHGSRACSARPGAGPDQRRRRGVRGNHGRGVRTARGGRMIGSLITIAALLIPVPVHSLRSSFAHVPRARRVSLLALDRRKATAASLGCDYREDERPACPRRRPTRPVWRRPGDLRLHWCRRSSTEELGWPDTPAHTRRTREHGAAPAGTAPSYSVTVAPTKLCCRKAERLFNGSRITASVREVEWLRLEVTP